MQLDTYSKQPDNAKIAFVHAAPGFVATNWGTEMPWWIKGPIRALQVSGGRVRCGRL